MIGRSVRRQVLTELPQRPVDAPRSSGKTVGAEGEGERIDGDNSRSADFDFLGGAGRDFSARVDAGSELGVIADDTEGTEDLGELVISEGGEEIEIVEATESGALEGSGQIGTEELGSLVEGNTLSIVRGDVVERREGPDDEVDEFDAAAAGSSDERGEGGATMVDESAGDLADVPNAPFQERNRPLASEEGGDLGIGEL